MEPQLKNLLYDNPELYEQIYPGSADVVRRACGTFLDGTPATLLDFGCGTGRDLACFADAGIACVGVDLQPGMIEYARSRRPGIDFRVGDMRDIRLGRDFDVVTCLGWALANLHTPTDIARAMATFAAHARPGTLVVLHLPNGIADQDGHGMRHRFVIDTPDFHATAEATYTFDRRSQLLTRRRTWRIPDRRRHEDFVRFRLMFPMELEHYLTSHGFTVLGMYDNTELVDSDLSGSVLYVVARFTGTPAAG